VGPPNHAALLAGVQAGNPDFDAIFRAYWAQMVKSAAKINPLVAEDAAQEAWLDVIRKGSLTPATTNVAAFLKTVAARRAIDLTRKNARTDPTDTIVEMADPTTDDEFSAVERKRAAEEVLAASWDQRQIFNRNEDQVFQYRFCSDHTQEETASALNLTRERISQIEGQVVKKLRAKLRVDRDTPPQP
jgi:RNA polymerase sigma factor (sigma-70 family)